jgi:Holliday junction DNA helicase RuvA
MIAKLTGQVDKTGDGYAVIDVNGIGYLVYCSNRTLDILVGMTGEVSVIIETHVREDHIHLYGFADEAEQACFKLLITVQGVGAKVCLAILSALPPDNLVQAIAARDQTAITHAPGVGPKLATRIVTELKDKITTLALNFAVKPLPGGVHNTDGTNQNLNDAVSALVNLGYGRSDAFRAVHQVAATVTGDTSVEVLIKEGLVELSANG